MLLSFFVQPAADDFSFSAEARESGLLEFQGYWYRNTGGRYISNLLIGLNPLVFGWITGYKILPVITIVFTFAASSFFFQSFVTDKPLRTMLPLIVTVLYLWGMPDITMGIFWMTGVLTYQWSLIAALLFFACGMHFVKAKTKTGKVLFFFMTLLLALAVQGFNETTAVIVLALTVIQVLVSYQNNKGAFFFRVLMLMILFFCTWFSFSAVGNLSRAEHYPERHRLLYSAVFSAAQSGRFILKWISGIPFIILTILLTPAGFALAEKKRNVINPWIIAAFSVTVIFTLFFIVYWNTGLLGQYRTVNVIYFFFIGSWGAFVFSLICLLKNKYGISCPVYSRASIYALLTALSLSILCQGNTVRAYSDLFSGKGYRYDKEIRERFYKLRRCKHEGKNTCELPILENRPQTLFFSDIHKDYHHWTNAAVSEYFGVDSIMAKSP